MNLGLHVLLSFWFENLVLSGSTVCCRLLEARKFQLAMCVSPNACPLRYKSTEENSVSWYTKKSKCWAAKKPFSRFWETETCKLSSMARGGLSVLTSTLSTSDRSKIYQKPFVVSNYSRKEKIVSRSVHDSQFLTCAAHERRGTSGNVSLKIRHAISMNMYTLETDCVNITEIPKGVLLLEIGTKRAGKTRLRDEGTLLWSIRIF